MVCKAPLVFILLGIYFCCIPYINSKPDDDAVTIDPSKPDDNAVTIDPSKPDDDAVTIDPSLYPVTHNQTVLRQLDKCERSPDVMELCMRCAKVTKSDTAYPQCCGNEHGVRKWCHDYVYYGTGITINPALLANGTTTTTTTTATTVVS